MATERKTRAVGYAFQHIPASPQSPIPYAHPTADRPLTPGNPARYLSARNGDEPFTHLGCLPEDDSDAEPLLEAGKAP